jgi:hypothetical protein
MDLVEFDNSIRTQLQKHRIRRGIRPLKLVHLSNCELEERGNVGARTAQVARIHFKARSQNYFEMILFIASYCNRVWRQGAKRDKQLNKKAPAYDRRGLSVSLDE